MQFLKYLGGIIVRAARVPVLLLVSLLGLIQAGLKFIKEIIILIINILFPLFPDNIKFEQIVMEIRTLIDTPDDWIEKAKILLL
jgi:hypothetical protein